MDLKQLAMIKSPLILDDSKKGETFVLENPVVAKLVEMHVTENNVTKRQRKCSIPIGQVYQLRQNNLYKGALEVQNEQVPTTDLFYEDIVVEDKLIKVTRNVRQGSPNSKIETFFFELQE